MVNLVVTLLNLGLISGIPKPDIVAFDVGSIQGGASYILATSETDKTGFFSGPDLGVTDGGIQVSDNPSQNRAQMFPQVVQSTSGSCIIAWEDNRDGKFEVRAQKLNGSGQRQWTSGDILISSGFSEGHRTSLSMCEDGSGGAFMAFANWHDITGRLQALLPFRQAHWRRMATLYLSARTERAAAWY